jgi:sn-glycerol 3-phosphate transport system ATP-binding protein
MDEPLSNLDAQLRLEMRREIRALQQRLEMTMVYVTHDQVEAMTMADRIILMRNGQIEQNGSPSDLYTLPATTFAARFVGTPPMNVVPGSAVANLPITPALLGNRSATDVSIGVRPEAVRLDPAGIPAELVAAEYLGADTLLETRMAGAPFVARIAGKTDAKPGATLHFSWLPEDQHLFDRTSEQRLV